MIHKMKNKCVSQIAFIALFGDAMFEKDGNYIKVTSCIF